MSKLSSDMLPLENTRICDFTIVWAGQSSTMYLADLGADCIRVENPYTVSYTHLTLPTNREV